MTTNLQERILLLRLELVRPENGKTTLRLLLGQTSLGGLEESEDVLNDNRLEVDLLLVVEVLSLQLNLRKQSCQKRRRYVHNTITHLRHVNLGVCIAKKCVW
jgi:hypothetical protein